MLKAKVWTAVALSAVIVATGSTNAQAFCHKYRSIPVWFGVYYPNCGPCGGCIVPYVASGCYSGYGYCGIGRGYGCGYSRGHGCVKKHYRLCAHKAWKRCLAGCGSCFDGCGDVGCYSGCSDCGSSDSGSEKVIQDGPAPNLAPPPSTPADASARAGRPLMMLTGMQQGQDDGSDSFEKGLTAYRQDSMDEATRQFEAASAAEPKNALFHYYRALALYDLVGAERAAEAREQAVEAERREPIKNWGKRMEREQGRARVWIEKARRDAGLAR